MIASTGRRNLWETPSKLPSTLLAEEDARSRKATLVAPQIAPAIDTGRAMLRRRLYSNLEPESCIGATLIATGRLRNAPATTGPDPLAAIRRLSQIEKIALFS